MLHFVPDDDEARETVRELMAAVPSGSYLVISHAGTDDPATDDGVEAIQDVYKRQTATPFALRTGSAVTGFFDGLEPVEPGGVWSPRWRPEPDDPGTSSTTRNSPWACRRRPHALT